MKKRRSAVVIGAGLAGLSAAIHMMEEGITPTVVEAKPYIGGRTASWEKDGMIVESGLHRYLGIYNHLPSLLKKAGIGLDEVVIWEDELEVRLPDGSQSVLAVSLLHKPLKTLTTAIGNGEFLSWSDKFKLVRFVSAGLRDYALRKDYLDTVTALDYAKSKGLDDMIIKKFLVPTTEGLFFLSPDTYSAFAYFSQLAPYVKSLPKMRLGAFRGGMSEVMCDRLAAYIEKGGGKVITGTRAEKIIRKRRGFEVICGRKKHKAEVVVLAASLAPAQQIIKASFSDEWFRPMLELQSFPSVTFQLELTEPSMPVDRTTFGPTTSISSFAEQSRTTFKNCDGRLSIILTPPHRFLHMDDDDVLKCVVQEAQKLGIDLKDKIVRYRKVVEPYDFYLLSPGSERLRPKQITPIPGLFLAGDYTKQEFVTTMEGAVYSGKLAARGASSYLD